MIQTKEQKKEYDKKRYQQNKERLTKQVLAWREKNIEKYEETAKKRLNTERGFMRALWQSVKDSGKHNSFKDFDDFYNHWLEQKKIYGMKCPATGIEMTTKRFNKKGEFLTKAGLTKSQTEDLEDIGRHLKSVEKSFLGAQNKLYEGQGNLFNQMKDLEKLGAKNKKNLKQPNKNILEE